MHLYVHYLFYACSANRKYCRWVQMNFVFCYLKETFSRLTLDWEERSEVTLCDFFAI